MTRFLVATIVIWLAAGPANAQQPPPPAAKPVPAESSPIAEHPEVAWLIVDGANRFRRDQELAELRTSEELTRAARYFAGFMAGTGKYGHDADGRKPQDRAVKYGYVPCITAENIGFQFSTEEFKRDELSGLFVEGWKDSAEHRANLLDPDLTEMGVAVAQSEKSGRYYAVQLFGRPRSQSIDIQVENRTDVAISYKLGGRSYDLERKGIRFHDLCRPADFTFTTATAGGERTVIQRVAQDLRLVIERDAKGELRVVESATAESR